jgi:hypothetical protein
MIDGPWRRYFVVCAESVVRHWWNPILRPGYRHCYLLIWEGAVWLHVDPTMDRTRVVILDLFDGFQHPAAWIEDASARIFEAWPEPDRASFRIPWIWAPMTCVEAVLAHLGIRKWWVWTPWQLAQLLRQRRRQRESQEAQKVRRGESPAGGTDAGIVTSGRGDQRTSAPDHPGADRESGFPALG